MRDDALASLSVRHVDVERRSVFQDARDVRTKNRKTFTSWFFPVAEPFESIVIDWIDHLMTKLLYGPDDPLFPATQNEVGPDGLFHAAGLKREHWKNADPVRRIFRLAFEAAGLPYFHPHSFHKCLAKWGLEVCPNLEAYKAWSQNLGHEHLATTLTSYGTVAGDRQAEVMEQLGNKPTVSGGHAPDAETINRVSII